MLLAGRYRLDVGRPGLDGRTAVDVRSGRPVVVRRVGGASDAGRPVPERPDPGRGGGPPAVGPPVSARDAVRLRHPAVVPVLDVVEQDGAGWVVEEYVAAPTLAERVPVDAIAVARIGFEIADALDAAADLGIAHGGITPAVVLLGPESALLGGFGVAWSGTAAADVHDLGATLRAAVAGAPAGPGLDRLNGVLDALLDPAPARRPVAGRARDMLAAVAAGRVGPVAVAGPVSLRPERGEADEAGPTGRTAALRSKAPDARPWPRAGFLAVGLVLLAVLLVVVVVLVILG